jgi:hypothetical protein
VRTSSLRRFALALRSLSKISQNVGNSTKEWQQKFQELQDFAKSHGWSVSIQRSRNLPSSWSREIDLRETPNQEMLRCIFALVKLLGGRAAGELGDAAVLVVEPETMWMQPRVLKKLRHALVALPNTKRIF